jgi:pimeloyl-ACP methyl ester carboxylesterase
MVARGYSSCDWGQVHYWHAGDAGPACVFFHESPLSAAAYGAALPNLGKHLRAYAFDTPGYGLSNPPPGDSFEIPDYAARLLQAIDALGLDRFAVAGVHTGASLAIEVARQAGMARVTHAVLTGVPLFPPEERNQWLASWSPPVQPDSEGEHLRWAWERYQRVWGPDSDPKVLHFGVSQILNVIDRYQWAYNAAFRYDPAPALPGISCPTLLLDAENDLLADYDEPAAALLPDARIQIIPGLPGQLPIRVPEAYAAQVVGFLT